MKYNKKVEQRCSTFFVSFHYHNCARYPITCHSRAGGNLLTAMKQGDSCAGMTG
ncbi:MAG: hypothetical protein LBN95_10040 [Prevotellaceae bacterium]|nr:hypothetical protein [Prevotellaceae bacterium]